MTPSRRAAIATGTLLLVALVAVLVADAVRPALTSDVLTAVGDAPERLAVGALCYLLAAGTSVGIAIALYPVLRPTAPGLALAAVVFRTIEASFYIVAVVALLGLRPLAEALRAGAPDETATVRLLADALLAGRGHATVIGVVAFAVGAACYYTVLYRARLVPRWLSGWGLVAVVLLAVSCVLSLVADRPVTGNIVLAVPIAVQEAVLGVWLLVRGFAVRPRTPVMAAAAA